MSGNLVPVLLPKCIVRDGHTVMLAYASEGDIPEGWKVVNEYDWYKITCPVCNGQHELPAAAAFCPWCGSSLEGVMSYGVKNPGSCED